MLVFFYMLIIAFAAVGGFIIRKKGIDAVRRLASIFLIGGGIALCACPLIFRENFIYFDHAAEHSLAIPVLIALSVIALFWFAISANAKKN